MSLNLKQNACVFGGQGGLGQAITLYLQGQGCKTWYTSRKSDNNPDQLQIDPSIPHGLEELSTLEPLDIIVWSQGTNANDSILDVTAKDYQQVMAVNVDFIVVTLERLWQLGKIRDGARLCMISSIWQELSRTNKFSYTVSKAAIAGLVRSASIDFGPHNILVNAILPGVVDTAMTRAMLSDEQKDAVLQSTPLGQFAQPEDIAYAVWTLVSPQNRAITGQCLVVDGGFSVMKSL